MNPEERVMAVLERANPMPENQPIDVSRDADAYLATLQTRSSEVTQLDTKRQSEDQRSRRTWLAVAAAVAVVLGVALVLLTSNDEPTATDDTVEPTPTTQIVSTTEPEASLDPLLDEALAVATAFTEARIDRDFETMGESAVEGHILGFVVGNLARMPEEFAWQEAVGWTTEMSGCELTNSDIANTQIECQVIHQNSLSEALGAGPFEGAYGMKVMYDGDEKLGVAITDTTVTEALGIQFPVTDFVNSTWRPFIDWLQETHPDDAQLMLGAEIGDGEFFRMLSAGWQIPTTTPESIELWRQYTAEFVSEQSG